VSGRLGLFRAGKLDVGAKGYHLQVILLLKTLGELPKAGNGGGVVVTHGRRGKRLLFSGSDSKEKICGEGERRNKKGNTARGETFL